MRSLAAVTAAAVALSASACSMPRSSKSTLTYVGAVTTGVGLLMVAKGPASVDSDHDGANEWPLNDDYTVPVLGLLLVPIGAAMLIGGIAARPIEDQPPPVQLVAAPTAPAPSAAHGKAALPEVAVDAETLRLAQQMRLIVSAGHCEPARELLGQISQRSASYHQALVQSPVLDRCPQLRSVSMMAPLPSSTGAL